MALGAVLSSIQSSTTDSDKNVNAEEEEELAKMVAAQTTASLLANSNSSTTAATRRAAEGYDDTLKDVASGRYGRILVRRSGKMEFVLGGNGDGNDGPEIR